MVVQLDEADAIRWVSADDGRGIIGGPIVDDQDLAFDAGRVKQTGQFIQAPPDDGFFVARANDDGDRGKGLPAALHGPAPQRGQCGQDERIDQVGIGES